MERVHPAGYVMGEGDLLGTRSDIRSQSDISDTFSVASSDEDHWGLQIGGYNEYNAKYPPPPMVLHLPENTLQAAKTVGGAELEAMLESGFDDDPSPSPTPTPTPPRTRYTLTDPSPHNGYNPVSQNASTVHLQTTVSPITPTTVTGPGYDVPWQQNQALGPSRGPPPPRPPRQQYGPLGPLDPGTRR
jgi:chitin synthase